jgi:hypothetical protein
LRPPGNKKSRSARRLLALHERLFCGLLAAYGCLPGA